MKYTNEIPAKHWDYILALFQAEFLLHVARSSKCHWKYQVGQQSYCDNIPENFFDNPKKVSCTCGYQLHSINNETLIF